MTVAAISIVYVFLFFALYFQVFLLVTFLENRKRLKTEEADASPLREYPSVTVIVPCWNEEHTIHGTVTSILNLRYPKEKLKIILVDDGSTDRSWEILQEYAKQPNISAYHKENGGKHTALNLALAHADTELVGCLDADSFVEPGALEEIVRYFEKDREVMCVTPGIRIWKPDSLIRTIQYTEYHLSIFFRKMFSYLDAIHVTPGPFSIFRKRAFDIVGPYREAHQTEDMEITMRMHLHHLKIVNAHRATVYTVGPKTIYGLYKQRLRWTRGFLMNLIDYRFMLFDRRYSNLSMFTLPAGAISVFSVLFFSIYLVSRMVQYFYNKFVYVSTIGTDLVKHISFHFDPFYLNTQLIGLLTVLMVAVTLILVFVGQRLADGKAQVSKSLVFYLALYGFLVPLWLARAVYDTAFSRTSPWR